MFHGSSAARASCCRRKERSLLGTLCAPWCLVRAAGVPALLRCAAPSSPGCLLQQVAPRCGGSGQQIPCRRTMRVRPRARSDMVECPLSTTTYFFPTRLWCEHSVPLTGARPPCRATAPLAWVISLQTSVCRGQGSSGEECHYLSYQRGAWGLPSAKLS